MPELPLDKAECGGCYGCGIEEVAVPEHWVPETVCIWVGRGAANGV